MLLEAATGRMGRGSAVACVNRCLRGIRGLDVRFNEARLSWPQHNLTVYTPTAFTVLMQGEIFTYIQFNPKADRCGPIGPILGIFLNPPIAHIVYILLLLLLLLLK